MLVYIYRGSWHINTKVAAQTLSYKMKNICPRQRRENYFKTLKLLQISNGKTADLQKPSYVWLRKTLSQLDCEANPSAAPKRNPIPVSRSPTRGGEKYAATGRCRGDIISFPLTSFSFFWCNWLRRLQRRPARETAGITHVWQQRCLESLESAALVSTKSVGSHTWNVIMADVDEWEFNGGTDGIYWTIVGRVAAKLTRRRLQNKCDIKPKAQKKKSCFQCKFFFFFLSKKTSLLVHSSWLLFESVYLLPYTP